MKSRKGKREGDKKAMRYSGGGYVSGNRVKSQINGSNTSLFNCATAVKYCAIAIISLLLCFVAIASAEEATNATPSISEITSPMFLKLIGVIAIILWLPFFAVFLALRNREKWKDYPLAMPKGSVRALLAFSLVVVIAIMLVLFRCFNEIISALLALLATIVGYYFGQRSVGAEPKPKTDAEEIVEKAEDYLDEMKKI